MTITTSNASNTKNHNNIQNQSSTKIIFVTVGTTLFTSLIDNILHPNTIQSIIQYGYTHLIIQYGKGNKPSIPTTTIPSKTTTEPELQYEFYDYKPSLYDDMIKANLIICHAGAGTLTEAIRISQQQQVQAQQLESKSKMKKIVTVINNLLMDNHQKELAYALQHRQLVYVLDDPILLSSSSSSLTLPTTTNEKNNDDTITTTNTTIWEQIESFQPSTQTSLQGNPYDVPRILHQFFHGTNNNHNRTPTSKTIINKNE